MGTQGKALLTTGSLSISWVPTTLALHLTGIYVHPVGPSCEQERAKVGKVVPITHRLRPSYKHKHQVFTATQPYQGPHQPSQSCCKLGKGSVQHATLLRLHGFHELPPEASNHVCTQ